MRGLLCGLILAVATPAWAQSEGTAPEGGPKVQEIRAGERGGFLETDLGITFVVI